MFIGRNFASVYSKMISQTIITFGSPKRKGLKLILVILMVLGVWMVNECRFFFGAKAKTLIYDIIGKSFHRNQRVRFWWPESSSSPDNLSWNPPKNGWSRPCQGVFFRAKKGIFRLQPLRNFFGGSFRSFGEGSFHSPILKWKKTTVLESKIHLPGACFPPNHDYGRKKISQESI